MLTKFIVGTLNVDQSGKTITLCRIASEKPVLTITSDSFEQGSDKFTSIRVKAKEVNVETETDNDSSADDLESFVFELLTKVVVASTTVADKKEFYTNVLATIEDFLSEGVCREKGKVV
jgi:hypothetical protein